MRKIIAIIGLGTIAWTSIFVQMSRGTGGDVEGTVSYRPASFAQGSLVYSNATRQMTALPPGSANGLLATAGAGANPAWTNSPTVNTNNMVFGIAISTTAAGAAGVAVTAPCLNVSATAKAIAGGCSCTAAVGITTVLDRPDVNGSAPTSAQLANGWLCQDAGGTGAQCAAFAVCINILQ